MLAIAKRPAPAGVVVLGWLWLIAAGFTLVLAASLLLVFGVVRNFTPGGDAPFPPAPAAAQPIAWAFEHYALAGSALAALALVGLWAGVQFLRLRPWARALLEAGCWLAILAALALGLWMSQFWSGTTAGAGWARRLVDGLFMAAYWSVFPAVFLGVLRSRSIAPAFARAPETSPS